MCWAIARPGDGGLVALAEQLLPPPGVALLQLLQDVSGAAACYGKSGEAENPPAVGVQALKHGRTLPRFRLRVRRARCLSA